MNVAELERQFDLLIDKLIATGRKAEALEIIEKEMLRRGLIKQVQQGEREIEQREAEAPPQAQAAIDQHQARIEPVIAQAVQAQQTQAAKPRMTREERREKQTQIGREFMKTKLYRDVMTFAKTDRGFGPATFIDGASMQDPSPEEKAEGKRPSFRMIRLDDYMKQFAAADTPELQAFALKLGLEAARTKLGTNFAPKPWQSYILMIPTPKVKVGESLLREASAEQLRASFERIAELLLQSGTMKTGNIPRDRVQRRAGGVDYGSGEDYSDQHVTGYDPARVNAYLKKAGIGQQDHDALHQMIRDVQAGKLNPQQAMGDPNLAKVIPHLGFALLASAKVGP